MPGTFKGVAHSEWVSILKCCSAEHTHGKDDTHTAPTSSKDRQAKPSTAANTREVNAEIHMEKVAAKKLATATTKALARNTVAPKRGQDPLRRAAM